MTGRIEPVQAVDVEAAAELADQIPRPTARDLLHYSVMARMNCAEIVTADRGFEALPNIRRLDPGNVCDWPSLVRA